MEIDLDGILNDYHILMDLYDSKLIVYYNELKRVFTEQSIELDISLDEFKDTTHIYVSEELSDILQGDDILSTHIRDMGIYFNFAPHLVIDSELDDKNEYYAI